MKEKSEDGGDRANAGFLFRSAVNLTLEWVNLDVF